MSRSQGVSGSSDEEMGLCFREMCISFASTHRKNKKKKILWAAKVNFKARWLYHRASLESLAKLTNITSIQGHR